MRGSSSNKPLQRTWQRCADIGRGRMAGSQASRAEVQSRATPLNADPSSGGSTVTFEQLGGLGEFIGALAVLGSLFYVAREIRENSRSTRLAAMQSAMLAAQDVMALVAQDRDLARVVRLGLTSVDELTEDEYQQFRYWAFLVLRVHEDMYVQHKSGVVDDETWLARSESIRTLFSTPGGRKIWGESTAYRADFRAWMDASGQDPPAS
jgi:hypothetical protein